MWNGIGIPAFKWLPATGCESQWADKSRSHALSRSWPPESEEEPGKCMDRVPEEADLPRGVGGGGDGHLQEKGTEYLRKSETAKTRRLPGALPKSMLWILKPSIRIKEADGPPLLRPRVRNVPKYKGKRKEENQREREEARKIAPGGLIFDEEDFQRGETYHEGTWGTSFTLLP